MVSFTDQEKELHIELENLLEKMPTTELAVEFFDKFDEYSNQLSYAFDDNSPEQMYLNVYKIMKSGSTLSSRLTGIFNNLKDEQKGSYLVKAGYILDQQQKILKEKLNDINILININNIKSNLEAKVDIEKFSELVDEKVKIIENTHSSALGRFSKTLSDDLNKLNKLSSDLKKDIIDTIKEEEKSTSNRIEIRIRNIDKSILDYQSAVKNAELRLNDYNDHNNDSLRKFSQEIRDEVITSINNVSSSSLEQIQLEQGKVFNSFNEKAQNEVGKINSRINAEVKTFESKKKDIEQILGEISTAHQSSANTSQADKEEGTANRFRWLGVIWLIITIFISIIIFNDYIGLFPISEGKVISPLKDLGLEWFAIRFTTITLLTTPGVYMLKESASHRSKENVYRQRGTQLSSIGAYLDELVPEERAKLKKELAKNFFSFHDNKADTSNVPDFIKNMKEAIELAKSISPHHPSTSEKAKKENTQGATG